MSLYLYDSYDEVPVGVEIIKENDIFFNRYSDLRNEEFILRVLKDIEQCERVSDERAISLRVGEGVPIYLSELSTGGKTAINTYEYPDKCFDLLECGDNATWIILSGIRNGNVVGFVGSVTVDEGLECDVIYHGKQCKTVGELLDWMYEYEKELDG